MSKKIALFSGLAVVFFALTLSTSANADSIFVIDDNSEATLNTAEAIRAALAGNEGSPVTSADYNTNHLLQELLREVGGTENATDGLGTASEYFNTNSLLSTAWLGAYGSDPAEGYLNPDALLSESLALPDAVAVTDTAQKDGQMRFASVGSASERSYLLSYSCDNGFLLTSGSFNEGKALGAETDTPICTNSNPDLVGRDRSLESLLGPLQYLAPADMADPADPTKSYIRLPGNVRGAEYYPIYAAAGFCLNATQKSRVEMGPSVATGSKIIEAAHSEARDSHLISNCWRFFEERVQYPANAKGALKKRHDAQYARCEADNKRHILSAAQLGDCGANGRSTLKARADTAYRLDSDTYIDYLNTLGIATRELLVASAIDAQEAFEQSLLLERQIMTKSLIASPRSEKMVSPRRQNFTIKQPE